MKKVILSAVLIPLASSLIPLFAAEGGEGSGFGAWRISVGGALNGGVKANVRSTYDYRGLSTLPGARPTWNNTTGIDLGGGAYVNPNSDYGVDGYTYNWQLPASAVQPDGSVVYESTFTDGTGDEPEAGALVTEARPSAVSSTSAVESESQSTTLPPRVSIASRSASVTGCPKSTS